MGMKIELQENLLNFNPFRTQTVLLGMNKGKYELNKSRRMAVN